MPRRQTSRAPRAAARTAVDSVTISEFTLARRVLFHETDMAGVVHFSCFFKYMEEAEHAMWRAVGLSVAPSGAEIGWPRVAASCEFRRPLRFEDEFETHLRVTAITDKRISYACDLSLGGERVASGVMTVACVSHRAGEPMRSIQIPQDVAARFRVSEEG